ncbi:MAG: type II toxin-antitoxin system RelE/ParE family toxin [Limisphaerales bacterium]
MSQTRIAKRSPAYQDLRRHALYLAAEAGAPVAARFLGAAEQAFATLAKMPGVGRVRRFPHAEVGELRSWAVPNFERYLIFYRALPEGIEVVRVLHGMRDLDRVFGGPADTDFET